MAFSGASMVWNVMATGSDTNNGGAFDYGQVVGTLTDLAATSANTASPVVTSASYSFTSSDVGGWLYIRSGTNWIPGFYPIVSVSGGAATLNAAIGQATRFTTNLSAATSPNRFSPTIVNGIATVASPTAGTWLIDFSQQSTARITYTDLASTGAGLTVTSVLNPFNKSQQGNTIVITGGTNFTPGRYVIASVSGVTATLIGAANSSTGVAAGGTGGLGGALATPWKTIGIAVANNYIFVQGGSGPSIYQLGTAMAWSVGVSIEGYSLTHGDIPQGTTRPVLQAAAGTLILLNQGTTTNQIIRCFILDGNSQSAITGYNNAGNRCTINYMHAKGCTTGFSASTAYVEMCSADSCGTGFSSSNTWYCSATNCTAIGFVNSGHFSIAVNCPIGFSITAGTTISSSIAYACTTVGFAANSVPNMLNNCIAEACGGGFSIDNSPGAGAFRCFAYNNTTNFSAASGGIVDITVLTASPFTNAAGLDFSLNNTAGGGALVRAAGLPGTFPSNVNTTAYQDSGAAQHQDSGGQRAIGYAG